jgi:transposase
MFIRSKKSKDKVYLQLVESRWVAGKCKQVVLKSLGRLDILQETGQIDSMLSSGMKFSKRLAVLDAYNRNQSIKTKHQKIGQAMIFERIWSELRIPEVLHGLLKKRKHEFPIERAIFITVLHRLCSSGSDRAAEKWSKNHKINGKGNIGLQHLYRAMGWLGERLPETQQYGATPFVPRCVKDLIEEKLFEQRRDLFTGLDLVFFDTTSIYFEGEGGETLGQYGHSKDHRPDLKQMVVGVILDNSGNPVCSELWPGNTTDVKSLVPIAKRLESRFKIERVCVVADRGMISKSTRKELAGMGWKYILGVRMRKENEVRKEVLSRGGRYEEVYPLSDNPKDPSPLKVKEVQVEDKRYVVCFNEKQAHKDAEDREAIVAQLERNLKNGDKSLIGNKGFRKYLRKSNRSHFEIDQKKIEEEKRYDGKWVLTTNTDLSARELALKYKQLWTVEAIFRSMKSVLETRPIYHKCDETIRGHVFCSFLALILRKKLEEHLARKQWKLEWADIIEDLDKLTETEIALSGKEYIVRSETEGVAGKIFAATGVALPAQLRQK